MLMSQRLSRPLNSVSRMPNYLTLMLLAFCGMSSWMIFSGLVKTSSRIQMLLFGRQTFVKALEPISSAVYSCDGALVFAGFLDGAVGVFDSDSLRLRCQIRPTAYISPPMPNASIYPMVIVVHPSDPNQVYLGMSDGSVHVVELSDADPKWGLPPPQENGSLPSISTNPSLNNSQASQPLAK